MSSSSQEDEPLGTDDITLNPGLYVTPELAARIEAAKGQVPSQQPQSILQAVDGERHPKSGKRCQWCDPVVVEFQEPPGHEGQHLSSALSHRRYWDTGELWRDEQLSYVGREPDPEPGDIARWNSWQGWYWNSAYSTEHGYGSDAWTSRAPIGISWGSGSSSPWRQQGWDFASHAERWAWTADPRRQANGWDGAASWRAGNWQQQYASFPSHSAESLLMHSWFSSQNTTTEDMQRKRLDWRCPSPPVRQRAEDPGLRFRAARARGCAPSRLGDPVQDEVGATVASSIASASSSISTRSVKRPKEGWIHQGGQSLESVKVGDRITGQVTNVTKAGAFLNIGAQKDGLLHASECKRGHIDVHVGDWISDVMISQVDTVKNRITLCLFDPNERHHVDGESNNLERDINFRSSRSSSPLPSWRFQGGEIEDRRVKADRQ